MDASASRLMSHVQNGVTIVHFTEAKVVDQRNINLIGSELTKMAESGGVSKMLINMENVRYLSSAMLGKLISLHKALRTNKATLKLCSITPPIYEVFEITRLDKVFDIYSSEGEALEAFRLGG
ncbi:MAG: STAS domain-containing protein [Planctomycetota bacterium]